MSEFSPLGELEGGLLSKIMNKKTYIAPAMEIVEMESARLLCGSNDSSGNSGSSDSGVSDKVTDDDASMANGRRGSWGNLWF